MVHSDCYDWVERVLVGHVVALGVPGGALLRSLVLSMIMLGPW